MASSTWLQAAISVAFVGEGVWRLVASGRMTSAPEKATAIFNFVNFLLFGLLGLSCVCWPVVSTWFHNKRECEASDSSISTRLIQTDVGVADEDPSARAPEPKRKITYLTNLKTFLTFIVVAHHSVGQWYNSSAGGIGTLGYDPNENQGAQQLPSFSVFAGFFQTCNQGYFMGAFFLISGLFCPRSLDRKGFRNFVLDKMVRLGGPFIIYSVLLGPAMDLGISAYGGLPLSWTYDVGPPWFILWLLNFSILYAVLAHALPIRRFAMPHPLLMVLFGFVLAPFFWGLAAVQGPWGFFGDLVFWNFGLFVYIPFFTAGVVGGRNGWLKGVEEMRTWVVWVLRAMCLVLWVILFLSIAQSGIPIPNCCGINNSFFVNFIAPVYAIVMTLTLMQLFHQYFNATPQSKLMKHAGVTAYAVYVIHLPILMAAVIAMVEILKAAGLKLRIFGMGFPILGFFPYDASGNTVLLPDGLLWAGFFFTLIVTNLVSWPLGFYMRQLPVLNKMF